MSWQLAPYFYLLTVASAFSAVLIFYVWRRRGGTPGAEVLALLLAGACAWAAGYALQLSSADLQAKVFWIKAEYVGIVSVPPAWLAFALRYTGREEGWLTRRNNVALLAAIPLITLMLAWTNEAHDLIWDSESLRASGPFVPLQVHHGAWFWVFLAYSYLAVLIGTVLLVSVLVRSLRVYRRQSVALLLAALVPWAGNGTYQLDLLPIPYNTLDLTPFTFLVSGMLIAFGVFRLRLLDLIPVAHENIIEGMSDGVVVVDPQEQRIVGLNPAAERALGCSASKARGEIAEALVPGWTALFERYQQTGKALGEFGSEELGSKELGSGEEPLRRRDYEMTLSAVTDRAGRRGGYLLLLRDVTRRKALEEERARQSIELARSNAELEQFAHSVSHDLRAPLRSISGFSQILSEEYAKGLDDEGRDYLRRVQNGAQRMGELIDDLLKLSRITRVEMHREVVDLSATAGGIVRELQRANPARRAEFLIAQGLLAEGDRRLLEVALENLLNNAFKFTSKKENAKIEFGSIVGEDGEEAYYVADNGAGFDQSYADKLFKPFERLHRAEEFEGTGIGLATVQRVVHRHGGRVRAEGAPEKGASFYFTLQGGSSPDYS